MAKVIEINEEDFRNHAKKVYRCVMSCSLSVTLGMIQVAYSEPQALIFRKEDGTTFLLAEEEGVPKEGEQEIFADWLIGEPGDDYGTFYVMPKWALEECGNVAS